MVCNLASGNSHVLEHLDSSRLKGRYFIDSFKPYLSRKEMLEYGEGIDRDALVNYKLGGWICMNYLRRGIFVEGGIRMIRVNIFEHDELISELRGLVGTRIRE